MGQDNMTLWDWLVFIKGGIEFGFVLMYCFVLWARDIVLLAFPERKSFRGDVILITGGASGIGRLMALRFAEFDNVTIVLWDLNEEALQRVGKEVEAKGASVRTYKVDVTNRELVYKTANDMKEELGKTVSVLINNAGIVAGKPFLQGSDLYSLKTMEVNAISHFWTVKAFLPDMVKNNYGHLITIASTAGLVGVDGLPDYCCSKAAAISFHEGIRVELRKLKRSGITTLLVNPYFIDTGMFEGTKTKAPFLLPILKPDYVADQIVKAAVQKRLVLQLPRYAYVLLGAMGTPASVRDCLYDYLGIGDNMADFKQTRTIPGVQ